MSAGTGPVSFMPGAAQTAQHRRDDLEFFAPEVSGLAGVRIEAADEDPRRAQAEEPPQVTLEHAQHRRRGAAA